MLDIKSAGEHVKDAHGFHLPFGYHVELPRFVFDLPVLGHVEFQLTKFMVLELVAAVLMIVIFIPLAQRLRGGKPPRGKLANFFEAVLLYFRDQVARPAIGSHHADRFLPFLWTTFFFLLFCNLLGAVPWAGSATAALSVTAAMALITFLVVIGSGMAEFGITGFWLGLVPKMDLPPLLAVFLKPMLWGIEVAGLLIKHAVLAVRLMANMFAGHLVLAVILGFIAAIPLRMFLLWFGVTVFSIGLQVALNMLELFVAFLQAYIFTFLAALFIGMAVHQH
ncbi:hypothetical protein JCM19992_12480 [Thermostilla marina]